MDAVDLINKLWKSLVDAEREMHDGAARKRVQANLAELTSLAKKQQIRLDAQAQQSMFGEPDPGAEVNDRQRREFKRRLAYSIEKNGLDHAMRKGVAAPPYSVWPELAQIHAAYEALAKRIENLAEIDT